MLFLTDYDYDAHTILFNIDFHSIGGQTQAQLFPDIREGNGGRRGCHLSYPYECVCPEKTNEIFVFAWIGCSVVQGTVRVLLI